MSGVGRLDFLNAPTPNRRTQLRYCLPCRPVPRAALASPQASRLRPIPTASRFPAPVPTPLSTIATAAPKPPTFTTHFLPPSLCQPHHHRCHLGWHLLGRGFSVRLRRHLFRSFPSPTHRHLSGRGFSVVSVSVLILSDPLADCCSSHRCAFRVARSSFRVAR